MKQQDFFFKVDSDAPALGSRQPALSDATNETEMFRALVVFAAGAVKFTSPSGDTDTWTIPEAALPYLIPVAVVRVWSTGTTVAAANLRGLL